MRLLPLGFLALLATCQTSSPVYEPLLFSSYDKYPLQVDRLKEASGITASNTYRGLLYSINDSGNSNEIFMLNYKAEEMGTLVLSGVRNRDWEDVVAGPGPGNDQHIYIAEMGDNLAQYDVKYIYRFKEPEMTPGPATNLKIEELDSIRFRFPDGRRDAEALLLEPSTKDLYIFSKREDTVGIYIARYPQSLSSVITVEKVGKLAVKNIVAGSISPDGRHVLLKTYDKVMYWRKEEDQPAYEVINTAPPAFFPYQVEPQGESITWHPYGNGYFTLSEEPGNHEASLFHYRKRNDFASRN